MVDNYRVLKFDSWLKLGDGFVKRNVRCLATNVSCSFGGMKHDLFSYRKIFFSSSCKLNMILLRLSSFSRSM